jgi:hypothetical protein
MKLIHYCRGRGTRRLIRQALTQNVRMLHLAERRGFRLEAAGSDLVGIKLALQD